MYGMGFGDTELDFENVDTGNKYSYTIASSPYAQIAGGFEYMNNNGFLISANLGYAILLKESNYEITKGTPTNDEFRVMEVIHVCVVMAVGSFVGGARDADERCGRLR